LFANLGSFADLLSRDISPVQSALANGSADTVMIGKTLAKWWASLDDWTGLAEVGWRYPMRPTL